MNTKNHSLTIYFSLLILLSGSFILGAKALGQQGMYLAQGYMLTPALAALVTRFFFYKKRFSDAFLQLGKGRDYLKYWLFSLLIALASYGFFYILGAIKIDLTGQTFLSTLEQQFRDMGQDMYESTPGGLSPKSMLWIFMIGQLTFLNIFPGIFMGFGEEFGHRGFMYTLLKKQGLLFSLIAGGLIWFAWHLPLQFILPRTEEFTVIQTVLNYLFLAIGSICTFTYLAYVLERSRSIWVVSLAHITLNNVSASLSYFVVIQDQFMANFGLTITMMLVLFFGPGKYFIRHLGRGNNSDNVG